MFEALAKPFPRELAMSRCTCGDGFVAIAGGHSASCPVVKSARESRATMASDEKRQNAIADVVAAALTFENMRSLPNEEALLKAVLAYRKIRESDEAAEQHAKEAVRLNKKGEWVVTVAHCVHCSRLCIAPLSDLCSCGAEMYPITKSVPLGVPMRAEEMKGA